MREGSTDRPIKRKNGFRYATSVGGTLTGMGGTDIIIDDPLKPEDAMSKVAREAVTSWYRTTLSTRREDKQTGVIIHVFGQALDRPSDQHRGSVNYGYFAFACRRGQNLMTMWPSSIGPRAPWNTAWECKFSSGRSPMGGYPCFGTYGWF
jgi:hypothetical protein